MRTMAKGIGIIGDSERVKGFGAVGIDTYICSDAQSVSSVLKTLAESEDYAIIYMTEELFAACEREREKYAERIIPAIIPLPAAGKNLGIGQKRLSSFVEKAVGSDILFKN